MESRLIDKIVLSNGLCLESLDISQPSAEDRRFVSLKAKMKVPLSTKYFADTTDAEKIISILRKEYGNFIKYPYTQKIFCA